jgi:ferredoxin-NADP reductase
MGAPRKIKAQIAEIRYFNNGITFFRLKTEIGCKFKPGQFLHLALDPYDPSFNWPESRVFSIANSPSKHDQLDILVSPKGSFTRRMIRELKTGSKVWVKLPFGIFDFRDSLNSSVVLIAGGTGVSPFISFLESLADTPVPYKHLRLVYGVRDPELIVFDDFLSECSSKLPGFELLIYSENEVNHPHLKIAKGMIPVDQVVSESILLPDPVFYLSGPPGMILQFETSLKNAGIPENKVLYDKWE